MSKKALLLLLCTVFALILPTGCQLALEDAEEISSKDRFVGVYLTYVHPYDNSDNLSYDGKIHATQKTINIGQSESATFEFEGLEGIALFHATVRENNDNVSYQTTIISPEVFDSKVHFHVTDNSSSEVTLVGRVYRAVSSTWENRVLSYNPVYQTPDGDIYLLPGTNVHGVGTVKLEESIEVNENGKKSEKSTSVELIHETINTTIKTVFKQMNVLDEIVDTTEVTPQEAPENIRINIDTAYIIVEEHGLNLDGQIEIVRTLLATDAIGFNVKYIGEHGFAIGEWIEIER